MRIINHRLDGVPFDQALTIGETIDPKFLVMHYTAGYTLASAQNVFKTTTIAAHIIIDRDGSILQMVPLNKKANHTGPSEWMGVKFLNGHSIGIEFVNIGWTKMQKDGNLVDAYGNRISPERANEFIPAKNARIGAETYFWQPYTEAQLAVGVEVTKAILEAYQIKDIVSHEEIDTRGWKTDPGPAFPMNRFTSLMRGVEAGSSDKPLNGMIGTVNTATLNIRGGPSTQFGTIGQTKLGSRVGIQEFKDGWYRIATELNGIPGSGWVNAQFVTVQ